MKLAGIHHITGFAKDGDETIAFYTRVLGLRLVKVTVNYDDPSSYHIYFSDHRGTPGTLLTFFLWPDAPRRPSERGQVERIAYAVPRGSTAYWRQRLAEHGVEREANDVISVRDPDGLMIDLIESGERAFRDVDPAKGAPPQHALGRFHSATLAEPDLDQSAAFLQGTLGMEPEETHESGLCLRLADGGELHLVQRPDATERTGINAPGVIHHIAFRASDDAEQLEWRERIKQTGIRATSVRERTYFRSIYFREPGGVLFEIATDGPGMTADEPLESLGERLVLPKWLEKDRESVVARLPALESLATAGGSGPPSAARRG